MYWCRGEFISFLSVTNNLLKAVSSYNKCVVKIWAKSSRTLADEDKESLLATIFTF